MTSRPKERLDQELVQRGHAENRTRAQSLVLAGKVFVDGQKITKAGARVSRETEIVVNSGPVWASRGALKLLKAIETFKINPNDKVCVDIGASSGGFTDVLLSLGAKKVFAVDVGYGQLIWRLRQDPRVKVMERTNARNLEPEDFDPGLGIAVVDVSFISLKKILSVVERILDRGGECVCLVKPQFEAGRQSVGKNGVVRNIETHRSVLLSLMDFVRNDTDMTLSGADFSPLLGPSGNIEFLFYIKNSKASSLFQVDQNFIEEMVAKTHLNFSRS